MLQRLAFALGFALAGVIATTGSAAAEFDPSRDELMVGTFLVSLGLMALLALVYAVKWYFGLDRQPPIDLPDPHAGHH
jgi:hypothetical protein